MAADTVPIWSFDPSQSDLQGNVAVYRPKWDVLKSLQVMHKLVQSRIIWVVDTEFCPIGNNARPVPFSISVRDARTGDIVLSTCIDYGGIGIDYLQRLIMQHSGSKWTYANKTAQYERHYKAACTHGMTLSAIGEFLRDAGFTTATHVLLSWWTSIDCEVICRALLGNDDLFETTPKNELFAAVDGFIACSQPFNLAWIVRHCSKLSSMRLGYVFRSLFPDQRTLEMHVADNDTLALVQISHFVGFASQRWL